MSQSAMSTPLIALNSTGPFRQYELTYDDCQISSISIGVAADQERLQVLLDGDLHHFGPLGERGTAQAVQARLAGHDLDDHQADPVGGRQDGPDVGDLHRRQAAALRLRARLRRRGLRCLCRDREGATGGGTG